MNRTHRAAVGSRARSWPSAWWPRPAARSDDKNSGSGDGRRRRRSRRQQLAAATLDGSGLDVPAGLLRDGDRRSSRTAQPAVTVTYARRRLRARARPTSQAGLVQWAGSDSTVEARGRVQVQGPVPLLPDGRRRRSRCRTTSRACDEAAALGRTRSPKIFQGEITKWNDAAIKADNPNADLPDTDDHGGAPGRRLGHHGELHQVPRRRRRRPRGRSAPTRPSTWPTGSAGRERQRRCGPDRQGAPTARSATSTSPTPRRPGCRSRRSRTPTASSWPASLDGATAALAGATVNADLTYDPLNASGADAYPITSPTYILVYTTQTRCRRCGNALKGFINYIYGAGQDLRRAPWTSPRCPPTS